MAVKILIQTPPLLCIVTAFLAKDSSFTLYESGSWHSRGRNFLSANGEARDSALIRLFIQDSLADDGARLQIAHRLLASFVEGRGGARREPEPAYVYYRVLHQSSLPLPPPP